MNGRGSPRDARPFKYAVGVPDNRCRAFIFAHHTAEPFGVAIQGGVVVVWALVREDVEPEAGSQNAARRLIVANTGAVIPDFPDRARFLGTVVSQTGIVWHVWDGGRDG